MPGARSRRRIEANYWPGFVDALSSLLLVIIFMLSLFMLTQFFLGQELQGRDTALARLNSQIAELTESLQLERGNADDLNNQIAQLTATLGSAQAQNAFYTDLEDWMTSMTELDHPVSAMQANAGGPDMQAMFDKLGNSMQNQNSSQNAIRAMAELARGIDGLVKHIRTEQDDLRKHIDEQGETNRKLRELIDAVLSQADSERRN